VKADTRFEQTAWGSYLLPESVRVAPGGKSVSWVDIETGELAIFDRENSCLTRKFVLPDLSFAEPVGKGSFLFSSGGTIGVWRDGRVQEISQDLVGPDRRFNDGCIDSLGRLVIGTKNRGDSDFRNVLLQIGTDGRILVLDQDLGLSNGIAVRRPSGDLLSVDSATSSIYSRPLEANGSYGQRTLFCRFAPKETPDGIATAKDGSVVVGLWGSSAVAHLDSSGNEIARWSVPARFVTSPALDPQSGKLIVASASGAREGITYDHQAGALWEASIGIIGLENVQWVPVGISEVRWER